MSQAQYILIFVCLCAVIIWIIFSYIKEKTEERKTFAAKTELTESPPVAHTPVSKKSTFQESEDSRYAIHQNMWVCAYCETLNPCPSGMKRVVDIKDLYTSPPSSLNGLRGDLFNKVNEANAGIVTMELHCTACGRKQKVTS